MMSRFSFFHNIFKPNAYEKNHNLQVDDKSVEDGDEKKLYKKYNDNLFKELDLQNNACYLPHSNRALIEVEIENFAK